MTRTVGPPPRSAGSDVRTFIVVAFGLSWSAWGLALVATPPVADIAHVAGSFGPSVAAVALLARRGGAAEVRRALAMLVRVRGGLGVILGAVLLPVLVATAAVLADRALGGTTSLELPPWWVVPVVVGYVLVLGGPLGEELGWRGHLLPALEARRGPTVATLVVGTVWFAWHLPLFLIPGTIQGSIPLWVFAGQIVTTSFLYTWFVHLAPHTLVPALAFHTSFNVTVGLVLLQPADAPAMRPLLLALGMVAVLAVALSRTATFRAEQPVTTRAATPDGSPAVQDAHRSRL